MHFILTLSTILLSRTRTSMTWAPETIERVISLGHFYLLGGRPACAPLLVYLWLYEKLGMTSLHLQLVVKLL